VHEGLRDHDVGGRQRRTFGRRGQADGARFGIAGAAKQGQRQPTRQVAETRDLAALDLASGLLTARGACASARWNWPRAR
jgi:hypothetical protein